jgi:hypothetical protein
MKHVGVAEDVPSSQRARADPEETQTISKWGPSDADRLAIIAGSEKPCEVLPTRHAKLAHAQDLVPIERAH